MVRPSLSLSSCRTAMDYSRMIWLVVETAHVLLSIYIINNVSFCCCCCFTVMLGGFILPLPGEFNRNTITWSKSTVKPVLALCAVTTPAAAAR